MAADRAATTRIPYQIGRQHMDPCVTIDLDAFVQQCRGKSVLRKIKKTRERVENGQLRFRMLRTPDQSQEGLSIFHHLHQARRTSVGDPGCFADERFGPFVGRAMERLMARDLAAYAVCDGVNGPVAIQLLLFSDTTSFMYQSGIDPNAGDLEPGMRLAT